MKWFRLYHDLPHDRKIRKFSAQQKWAWVVLLCLASESKQRGLILGEDEDVLSEDCGFDCAQDFQYFLDKLRQQGMIEHIEGGIKVVRWDKRQSPDFERPHISVWKVLREKVFKRDNYTCQYCGACGVALQCDHIYPLSRGGSNGLENLQAACKPCNLSKHNKTLTEWKGGQS
jgi:hypothetical protein